MSIIDELQKCGIQNIKKVYHNLDYDELYGHELKNHEGCVTDSGCVSVDTGIFTGRSPKDKYFVNQPPSNKYIAWGDVNHPISKEIFDKLFASKKRFYRCSYCINSKRER